MGSVYSGIGRGFDEKATRIGVVKWVGNRGVDK